MATATKPLAPSRLTGLLLHNVPWDDYEAMLRIIGERRIYVNYDQGVMEVLVPSFPHEDLKDCLRLLIDILGEELALPMRNGGSTTLRQQGLEKGVEPDECYWLGPKAQPMTGRRPIHLPDDPAPSLVIEVNYTSSSVERMAIYAALGVEEVWRYDDGLRFLALNDSAQYEPTDTSRHFPTLTLAEAAHRLDAFATTPRLDWMRAFRLYVRDNLAPRPLEGPNGG